MIDSKMDRLTDKNYFYPVNIKKRKEYQKAYYEKHKKDTRNKNLVRNKKNKPGCNYTREQLESYINILLNDNARRKAENKFVTIKEKRTVIFFD